MNGTTMASSSNLPKKTTTMLLVEYRLGQDVTALLRKMVVEGLTQAQIAKRMDVHQTTIGRWLMYLEEHP